MWSLIRYIFSFIWEGFHNPEKRKKPWFLYSVGGLMLFLVGLCYVLGNNLRSRSVLNHKWEAAYASLKYNYNLTMENNNRLIKINRHLTEINSKLLESGMDMFMRIADANLSDEEKDAMKGELEFMKEMQKSLIQQVADAALQDKKTDDNVKKDDQQVKKILNDTGRDPNLPAELPPPPAPLPTPKSIGDEKDKP